MYENRVYDRNYIHFILSIIAVLPKFSQKMKKKKIDKEKGASSTKPWTFDRPTAASIDTSISKGTTARARADLS